MAIIKKVKDKFIKILLGSKAIPRGLLELDQYFRLYGPIHFRLESGEDSIIAISDNFRHGSIITSGKNIDQLDKNIKDAILTSFEVPSSYAEEAKLKKINNKKELEYALA